MAEWFTCTTTWAGPAADGTETPAPVVYIALTDQKGSFNSQWFYAADNAKDEMLTVALTAISQGLSVEASVDPPNPGGTPYTQIHRLYLTNGLIPGG